MSSNTTPAPNAKPHGCSKCTRSFTTSKGLHDHGLAMGHCIPCTKPGCERYFSSEVALRDHLASSVHASRKPVGQNEQTVKVISSVSKRTIGTNSSKQQHICTTPGCQKSFKTLEARAQHLDSAVHAKAVAATPIVTIDSAKKSGSVQHKYTCTAPGCKKSFKTVEARTQHLNSAAHKKAVMGTGPHERKDAKAIVAIASAQNAQFGYACTAPGCKRVFKTLQSRAQHQDSAAHKKAANKAASPEHNKPASIVVPSSSKSSTPLERQSVPIVEAASSREGLAAKDDTTSIPKVQTKIANAQKPPQPHPANPKDSEKTPLFLWDTRWTSIPSSAHSETITALHCLLSPPKTQLPTSSHTEPTLKSRAIVLDCEMVGVGPKGSISALARLSAVDFLTGELLIDTLVQPFKPVTDWRTNWSGITPALFKAAKAKGQVLEGTAAARKELLQYMDARTVLIGHALHYDLKALGIGHTVTVDSAKVARAAVGNSVKKDWGLKVLCKELLGITVQDHGRNGHDSVEDALAAREVVLWCLRHPEELGRWGARKKEEEVDAKKKEDAEKKSNKRQKQSGVIIAGTREVPYLDDSDDDWEYQNMSLREFNEMCGYPSDFDNWSD